jgi:hypothetical protein
VFRRILRVNHLETSYMKLPLEQLFDSHNLLSSSTFADSLGLAIHAK